MGGLVARGEGTAAWKPKPAPLRLNSAVPGIGIPGGGGLPAEPEAPGVLGGAVPLLNSAQRGHFRFVSSQKFQSQP